MPRQPKAKNQKVKRPKGRPSLYSPELAETICRRLASGQSLREVGRDEAMPHADTIRVWLLKHDEFSAQYTRACEARADHWAEEIVEIADDGSNDWMERQNQDGSTYEVVNHEHISRSKLRVDARKWLMAKAAPKKYGERITQEVTGKDGGPIETKDTSDVEAARKIAFMLAKATVSAG